MISDFQPETALMVFYQTKHTTEREKQHLAELGFTMDNLFEINFVVGQMTSNNMVFASLVNEGAPIEDFLKGIGPFADTVYAKKDL